MSNALDMFREQQDAARQVHNELVGVTALLEQLQAQVANLTERKTAGDSRDWVKTIVAFANSVAFNQCGVLYIGVTDHGEIEPGLNLDQLQKTLKQKLEVA